MDGIEWQFLAEDARPLRPSLLAGLDGLYHFSAPVDAGSLDGVDRSRSLRDTVSASTSSTSRRAPIVASRSRSRRRWPHPMASAAVTLVLALAHRLRERDRALHEGNWADRRFEPIGTASRDGRWG